MKLEIVDYVNGPYRIVELEEPEWVSSINPWHHYDYKDVNAWCEQTFGPQDAWGAEPVSGWKSMRNRYYFVGEDKLNWFLLRWS